MIHTTSILRRLPADIDRKQLLFFDGIRHAAEIVSLAYSRLQSTLTHIALSEDTKEASAAFPVAFLDAWAVVDGIDRFRVLWKLMPGAPPSSPKDGESTFEEISQPVRNLRNVADHLAQRADYIIAQNGTALGSLSWYTALRQDGREGIICSIAPGTQVKGHHRVANPAGRTIEYPTGLVQLSAGEYQACLSDVLPHMEQRIRELEGGLDSALAAMNLTGRQAGTDLLVKIPIVATDVDGP
ncbi:hypothetical protein [Solimonas sp. K1W22B-7]|uniref:hypothetical protein n=1 Tax=Solimonas sp. K1W22B-7 TaxID=2303331 RepID=UPI0013C4DC5A|nr:hypothetical protein [Solimonas sp. K1W22B-7]